MTSRVRKRRWLRLLIMVLVPVFGVGMFGLYGSKAKADDLPVVNISGILEENETWTNDSVYVVESNLTIPEGVTLTVDAGTIVKISSGASIFVMGGNLDINGSSSSRVIITSLADDSVGGDSGGDGITMGSPGDYSTAINAQSGSATVDYAIIRNGTRSALVGCGSLSPTVNLADSIINSTFVIQGCESGALSLLRNSFAVSLGEAIRADESDVSGIALSGLNTNYFTGTGKSISIFLNSSKVSQGNTWIVSDAAGAILQLLQLNVAGTLELEEGVIVKGYSGFNTKAINVAYGGVLNVRGAPGSPVTLTSIHDDSIGGDTGGDGTSTPSGSDYTYGIWDAGGTITLEHANIRYGQTSLITECSGTTPIQISDNEFGGTVSLNNCATNSYLLQRNHFEGADSYAIKASSTDPTGIILDGLNKNTFSGDKKQSFIYLSVTIPAGSTWTISGSSGASLAVYSIDVRGQLEMLGGVVVKHLNVWNGGKIAVHGGANLTVDGGSGSPAVFTSFYDDSIKGDTDGGGSSAGSPSGDYATSIAALSGADINVQDAVFRYAAQALSFSGGESYFSNVEVSDSYVGLDLTSGGDVVYRGSFTNIASRAIKACNWSANYCSMDATYVDWDGNASGPFVVSGTDLACGKVAVSPWRVGGSTSSASFADVENCDGSSTLPENLAVGAGSFNIAVAQKRIDCDNGFQDACSAIATAFACLGSAINIAASQSPIPVSYNTPTETLDTTGADTATAVNTALLGTAVASPSSFSLNMAQTLGNVFSLYGSLYDAYNACRP